MKIKFDVLSLIIFSKHPKGLVSPFDRLFIHPCGDVRVYHATIFNKFISYFSGVFLIWQDMFGLSLVTYTNPRKQARMNKRINMLYNRWPVHICFEMHWHILGNSKPLWKKQRILWSHVVDTFDIETGLHRVYANHCTTLSLPPALTYSFECI